MHILYDEDEFETIIHSKPCTSCGGDLGKCRGVGCNGSGGISSRRRSPAEVKEIKAKRLREHEDTVLAQAAAIRARRWCDCFPWPGKCPYCGEGQPTGTKAETASQIVGAFLMMHNVAPWEADELVRWLAEGGYKITPATLSVTNGDHNNG